MWWELYEMVYEFWRITWKNISFSEKNYLQICHWSRYSKYSLFSLDQCRSLSKFCHGECNQSNHCSSTIHSLCIGCEETTRLALGSNALEQRHQGGSTEQGGGEQEPAKAGWVAQLACERCSRWGLNSKGNHKSKHGQPSINGFRSRATKGKDISKACAHL